MDGSTASTRARKHVLLLTGAYDGEIHALAVLSSSDVPEDVGAAVVENPISIGVQQTMNEAIALVIEASEQIDVSVTDSIRRGAPVKEILAYATENGIDLVVLGARMPGRLARFLCDSVIEQATQQPPAPMWSVWEGENQEPVGIQQILMATSDSEGVHRASEYVFDLGSIFDASVRGLYAMESRLGSTGLLHTLLSREGERALREFRVGGVQAGIGVTPTVREGQPINEILPAASNCNADLIALGAQGKTELDRLVMGSAATSVVCHADRPVLTARELMEERSSK